MIRMNTARNTTRKSAKTIQRHFSTRLIILDDRVNVHMASKGIDAGELSDFTVAANTFKIPRLTVAQEGFTTFLEELERTIVGNPQFCQGIDEKFIKKSLKKEHMIVYVKNQQYPYDILGFATVSILSGRELYVDLLCANLSYAGMGRHIMKNVLRRIQTTLELDSIVLCSTRAARPFYDRMGFERVPEQLNDMCIPPLTKMVWNPTTKTRRTAKTTRTLRTLAKTAI